MDIKKAYFNLLSQYDELAEKNAAVVRCSECAYYNYVSRECRLYEDYRQIDDFCSKALRQS